MDVKRLWERQNRIHTGASTITNPLGKLSPNACSMLSMRPGLGFQRVVSIALAPISYCQERLMKQTPDHTGIWCGVNGCCGDWGSQ